MNDRPYLIVSGSVFSMVSLVHLARVIFHWPLQIGTWTPQGWVTGLAIVVPAVLAAWAFILACRKGSAT